MEFRRRPAALNLLHPDAEPALAVELRDWIAEDFDPKVVDTDRLAGDLTALAKRWSRKPTTRRPRSA